MRADGRNPDEPRPCTIERGYIKYAEGSALIRMGETHVLCVATVTDRLPRWLVGSDQGWITAEYSLLPRATQERTPRESSTATTFVALLSAAACSIAAIRSAIRDDSCKVSPQP